MSKKAFEIRQKRADDIKAARTILDHAEAEKRSMTDPEKLQYETHLFDAEKRKEQADRIENLDGLEAEIQSGKVTTLGDPLPHEVQTRHRYSILRAIRGKVDAMEGNGKFDGLEREVHDELEKRSGRASRGVRIPYSMGPEPEKRADLTTATGVGSIPTILDQNLIDILRPRMVTAGMGATIMEGMQGLFAIPRQSGTNTMYWVAEGANITTGNQTVDQVAFTPRTAGAMTNYSRRFVEQTNQNAEQFVRNDLMAIIARGIETAAFNGLGAGSNQPTGILQNSAIATLMAAAGLSSGANGGPVTWANLVLMEQVIATANADIGKLSYVCDAAVRGHLKRTLKVTASTFPIYLWAGGAEPVNEHTCPVTNLLPGNLTKGSGTNLHPLIYGNWQDLIYAFWSGMDVVVDPYSGAANGGVRIVILQDVDINVRHPESFGYLADIIPS
jgi:HK97 family phage major capsid protein